MVESEGPEAKKAKFAPPTVEEVAALRECQDVYTGRLAQLKIDEILNEISLSTDDQKTVKKVYDQLVIDLKQIDARKNVIDLEQPPQRIETVAVPMVMDPVGVKGQLTLTPPTSIRLGGAYVLNAAIKMENEPITLDLMIQLPNDSMMQEKDHWDERFFRKRAIYLAYLASQLGKLKKYQLEFGATRHRIKPKLTIQRDNVKFEVAIACEPFCKPTKWTPNRSNIHYEWWNQSRSDSVVPPPTPLYNSLALADIERVNESSVNKAFIDKVPSIGDGLKLFALYVRQSQLEHLAAFDMGLAICRHLFATRRLPRLASGFQIFKLMLEFIADGGLSDEIVHLGGLATDGFTAPALVLESGRNVLAPLTRCSLEWIQYVMGRDQVQLKQDQSRALVNMLVERRPFALMASYTLSLPSDGALDCVLKRNKQFEQVAGTSGDCALLSLDYLCLILKTALKDRIVAVNPRLPIYPAWSIVTKAPNSVAVSRPTIGMVLSDAFGANHAATIRGPVADQPQARQFKSIWGGKTDERRFQDGAICVAAHFDGADPIAAASEYLIKLHGSITAVKCAGSVADEADEKLHDEFKPLNESFNELEQALKSPELTMPLKIQQCWPMSPSLRGTSIIPAHVIPTHQPRSTHQAQVDIPEVRSLAPLFSSNLVMLQLEGSSQWPQDIDAIRQLRKAYHIRLAELLTNKFKIKAAVCDAGMGVLCRHNSFAFKLVTVYHREAELMKQHVDKSGMLITEDNPRSEAEELKTQIRPQLSLVLSKLNTIEQSTCRLFRRWLSAHMLTSHFDHLLSDLLVYAALNVGTGQTSCGSVLNGFYRLMRFLANHDFVDEPVFIISSIIGDEHGADINEAEQLELREYFREKRLELFRQSGILISSKIDKTKSLLTRQGPSFALVKKMQAVAEVTAKSLGEMIATADLTKWDSVFTTSTKWLDAVITLRRLPGAREKEMKDMKRNRIEVPDWDLAQMLIARLTRAYGHLAMFFCEEANARVVGVKFKKLKEAKGLEAECMGGMAHSADGLYANRAGLLNDFRIIGAGLIDQITVQKE